MPLAGSCCEPVAAGPSPGRVAEPSGNADGEVGSGTVGLSGKGRSPAEPGPGAGVGPGSGLGVDSGLGAGQSWLGSSASTVAGTGADDAPGSARAPWMSSILRTVSWLVSE